MRAHLQALIEAALGEADAERWTSRACERVDLAGPDRVLLIAVGKAAIPMARAALALISGPEVIGLVVTKAAAARPPGPLEVLLAGHPLPDERSLEAGRRVGRLLEVARAGDLVLVLLSGGASSLLCTPAAGVSLEEIRTRSDSMMRSGADIATLNRARIEMETLKGGGLARAGRPARVVGLVISDVPGDDPALVGSGPTYPGAVTQIIGTNAEVLRAVARRSAELGYRTQVDAVPLVGEAAAAGEAVALRARALSPGQCLIMGGETTVRVRGTGVGGRNLEVALAAAIGIAGEPGLAIATLATDGEDGPSGAAGALVTGHTVDRATEQGLDAHALLSNNDSLAFFRGLGDLIETGPTLTNVGDVTVVLRSKA